MRRIATLALLLSLMPLLPACQSQDTYWQNRFYDATDIVQGHVIAGQAFGAQIEATHFLSLGWTSETNAWCAGWCNRHFSKWHETVSTWGLILGRHDEQKVVGIPRVSGSYGWKFGKGWPTYQSDNTQAFMPWFAVRGTVAVIVGVDIEVRLGEVVDFIGGIFTWDPSHDDKK